LHVYLSIVLIILEKNREKHLNYSKITNKSVK